MFEPMSGVTYLQPLIPFVSSYRHPGKLLAKN